MIVELGADSKLAFAMISHPRLGADAHGAGLEDNIVRLILEATLEENRVVREMHAVGTEAGGDTLTEVTTWLSWRVPWAGALVMGFLTWLWVHFARRILPAFWKRNGRGGGQGGTGD
jgi:hypothetical protein